MENTWKQYLIINSSLNMSSGKSGAQASHASLAFFMKKITEGIISENGDTITCQFEVNKDLYDHWMNGIFTKVCLDGKNEKNMEKIVKKLEDNGFKENQDFFRIVDVGTTEFNGIPHWTAIGLAPMDSENENLKKVMKRLQVLKDR